jgi:hypothetical protein
LCRIALVAVAVISRRPGRRCHFTLSGSGRLGAAAAAAAAAPRPASVQDRRIHAGTENVGLEGRRAGGRSPPVARRSTTELPPSVRARSSLVAIRSWEGPSAGGPIPGPTRNRTGKEAGTLLRVDPDVVAALRAKMASRPVAQKGRAARRAPLSLFGVGRPLCAVAKRRRLGAAGTDASCSLVRCRPDPPTSAPSRGDRPLLRSLLFLRASCPAETNRRAAHTGSAFLFRQNRTPSSAVLFSSRGGSSSSISSSISSVRWCRRAPVGGAAPTAATAAPSPWPSVSVLMVDGVGTTFFDNSSRESDATDIHKGPTGAHTQSLRTQDGRVLRTFTFSPLVRPWALHIPRRCGLDDDDEEKELRSTMANDPRDDTFKRLVRRRGVRSC